MGRKIDLIGQKFGRLTVFKEAEKKYVKYGTILRWWCICECGNDIIVQGNHLGSGDIKSCGCLHNEGMKAMFTTHGQRINRRYTKEYTAWAAMKNRCSQKNRDDYKNYGGRGIKVCDRWLESFENFFEDIGKAPSRYHSLDRINNDRDYEKSNCRWATKEQQGRNRRSNRYLEHNGEKMLLVDWAKKLNTTSNNIGAFFRRGKSFDWIVEYYENQKSLQVNAADNRQQYQHSDLQFQGHI